MYPKEILGIEKFKNLKHFLGVPFLVQNFYQLILDYFFKIKVCYV